jgi:hypothetical protein
MSLLVMAADRGRLVGLTGQSVLPKSHFFARREDSGSSADRGAGLWPATPASLPASFPMAARMPGPEGTPAG